MPDSGQILRRHPQHLRDEKHRQRDTQAGDDVHAPARSDRVEQPINDRLDGRAHAFDARRRERLGGQRADPRLLGRIEKQHLPLDCRKQVDDVLMVPIRAERQDLVEPV